MTTTAVTAPPCSHDARACCFLCSDQVAWWAAARVKAGYGEWPPNEGLRACLLAALRQDQIETDKWWKIKE